MIKDKIFFLLACVIIMGLSGCTTTSTTSGAGVTDPSHPPSNNDLSAASYVGVDNCKTCHPNEYTQWKSSAHAAPSSHTGTGCGYCHATGYKKTGGYGLTSTSTTESGMYFVQCEECHGPGSLHVTQKTNSTINKVPNAETTCGKCHRGRPFVNKDANGRYDSSVDLNDKALVTSIINAALPTSGTASRHPIHYRPNLPVFKGTGGYEYAGSTYSNSYHTTGISNACVTCHFQFSNDHDPSPDLAACQACHPGATDFNVSGRNTEILGLIETLRIKLAGYETAVPSLSSRTSVSYTKALWNYYLISREADAGMACAGAHNFKYAKQLLQDAINNFDPNNP